MATLIWWTTDGLPRCFRGPDENGLSVPLDAKKPWFWVMGNIPGNHAPSPVASRNN